ncbi:MAG: FtsX-like permease family protein [Planctomycetota bacterium]|nr:FtsX-like permease family protein [Planctomycetota bacterium]MDA1163911.1 FtsX-like permease family protein [Planctomycetota bacterium]
MSVWRLVLREMKHRKVNFAMSLLSVTVAIACLVGAQTLLRSDELQTETILTEKQTEIETAIDKRKDDVAAAGKALEDSVRKQMLGLGFNVLIVPENQDLSELHLNGTLTETIPESYVDKLANSKIVTINHLLPSVTKRVKWPEKEMDIIVQGTRGEVPIMHRDMKKALLDAVPPGTMVVGYELHSKLGLKAEDKVTLLGREFTIKTLHPSRGSADDVTIWIDLAEAQELLGMENVINAILALECGCTGDRISEIRAEIAGILPGTKVIERYSQALTRAESRATAKVIAEEALAAEQDAGLATLARETKSRTDIQDRRAGLASILVPLVLVACALWIGFLAFGNVRQRTSEIGILRAIGLSSNQVLAIFLIKSGLTGLLGGLVGTVVGVLIGIQFGGLNPSAETWQRIFEAGAVLSTVILAPILAPAFSTIASWLPAQMAARRDPAVVLQTEI